MTTRAGAYGPRPSTVHHEKRTRPPMTDKPDRLTPHALRCAREALGLGSDDLASILDVRHDTARRWESGREPVPYNVPAELNAFAADLDRQAQAIAADPDIPIPVWANADADLFATAHPTLAERGWTPRIWRIAVGRADLCTNHSLKIVWETA